MVFFVIMRPVSNINPLDTATPEAAPVPSPGAVKPGGPDRPRGTGRRGGCLPWAILFALLLGGFLIWKFPSFRAQAELGSAYAARIGCSCRYVQGRSLESCQGDLEPGMEMVSLSDDPGTRSITGSVPLLASRRAHYAGASGCLLEPAD